MPTALTWMGLLATFDSPTSSDVVAVIMAVVLVVVFLVMERGYGDVMVVVAGVVEVSLAQLVVAAVVT